MLLYFVALRVLGLGHLVNMRLTRLLFFGCFFGLLAILAWHHHPTYHFYTWLGVVWADVSGYFIYLPATFYYGWDASLVPPEAFDKLGQGFFLQPDGIIRTKYTYGVALLLSPFYALVDLFFRMGTDFQALPGMTIAHQRAVLFGGVFYAAAGAYWLSTWLQRYATAWVAKLWVVVVFLGSNLLFYSIDYMGMSHVYSFALFAALLLLVQRLGDWVPQSPVRGFWWWMLGALLGLTVVIRPTNALFVLPLWWLHRQAIATALYRMPFKELVWAVLFVVLGGIMLLFPQMLYWKYAFGSWVTYSYTGEGFNWTDPALRHFWFALSGGMWWYIPILWLALPAWWYWCRQDAKEAGVLFFFFFLMSYVNSCWWSWNFGGSYGARAMAEYSVFLVLPLAKQYPGFMPSMKGFKRFAWVVLLLFILFYSFKLTYSFKRYWFGGDEWDVVHLLKMIFK